ncbi:polymeric immunoglobulin receptor-like [Alosa pseudoharengus]|uniref:polymeric immunoglobulin receptor-like n=1 Tax=Alosa pseudoharengus TaxID=34774 RepID=UPI003F8AA0E2
MRLLLFTLYLLTALCDGELISVTGALGGSVDMSCQYSKEHEHHNKTFCKVEGNICPTILHFTEPTSQTKGRFTMTYNREERSLFVSISALTEEDTAVYWCGFDYPNNKITGVEAFVLHVTPLIGYEGGELRVRCPYERRYEKNGKYFNRVGSPHHNKSKTLIQTNLSQTQATEGRFSLYDDTTARVFTVTITGLNAEDSGKYECGVKRNISDIHELQVLVKQLEKLIGYESESVSITCKYQKKKTGTDENKKYFCKGPSPSECINTGVKVQTDMTVEDRFSLRDEPTSEVFTVTITDLRAEDAGIYWCVEWCDNVGYIYTTAVKVEVETGPPVMLTVCLAIAVLVLGIAVLICIKHRRTRTQGLASTSVNSSARQDRPVDCVYEEVKDTIHPMNPEATVYANTQLPTNPSDGPTYSTLQLPTNPSDGPTYSTVQLPTNPSDGPIYSTLQLPTNPSDGPTYSTVSFHKNQEAAAETDVTFSLEQDTCEYSSVNHPTK